MKSSESADVVLVVDDEEPVRRTVRDWLTGAKLGLQVLTAGDSESALLLANQHVIDLAVLDWNLGAGLNGLELLQDLAEFNPAIVAIMITAFADQATPLDAMRSGVRDYLDKNHELTRDKFLAAVKKQLDDLRPAKRERQLHQSLLSFREALARVLPDVQTLAALNDPVTLPEVIGSLFRFLVNTTRARGGVLFVRHYDHRQTPPERCRVFDAAGEEVRADLVPFPRSVAATAVSLQEPCAMTDLERQARTGTVELQPFERGCHSLLAAPLAVAPGLHVVVELIDKLGADGRPAPDGFTPADVVLTREAGEFGAETLRQALAQRQSHQLLLDAVKAALQASERVSQVIEPGAPGAGERQASDAVLEQLREGLSGSAGWALDPEESLQLAEAIRRLALSHGAPALRHCTSLVDGVRRLLDEATGV